LIVTPGVHLRHKMLMLKAKLEFQSLLSTSSNFHPLMG
jgi:hypothetical protein